jgi:hypothetical protein
MPFVGRSKLAGLHPIQVRFQSALRLDRIRPVLS